MFIFCKQKERNLFTKTNKKDEKRAAIVGYGNIGHYVLLRRFKPHQISK